MLQKVWRTGCKPAAFRKTPSSRSDLILPNPSSKPSALFRNVSSHTASGVGTYYAVIGNSSGSVVSGSATLSATSLSLYSGIMVNGPIGSTYMVQYTISLSGTPIWTTLGSLKLTKQFDGVFQTLSGEPTPAPLSRSAPAVIGTISD